ncbi:hypothetical protein AC1659_29220 [Rhodococcus erythropolis]|uniref:hypothetical protein n=1 Tax=Rhodococcus erythropolis TaxID=1833 RepID=UPI001BA64A83|nr:hypothetical protein [Rhodococcus erythropolis]MBS2993385.1 hypothetical protein [Rhodococcus erythropolis]
MTKTTGLHRIRVTGDTYALLDEASGSTGHSYDTVIQLWAATAGADTAAVEAARRALSVQAATQDELRRGLADCAPNLRVAAIRLDKRHASPSETADGFERTHSGADLTTNGVDLWRSVRGYWVIAPRSNAIAAYRLGHFLGLYAGISWSGATDKRRFALTGYRIDGGNRVNPETGDILQPASSEENEALKYLAGHTLAMPTGAANPIANLFTN